MKNLKKSSSSLRIFAKLRYDIVRTGNDMGPAAFLSVSLKYSYNEYFEENGEKCSRAQSSLATIWLNIYIYILFPVLVDVGMKRISLS